MRIYVSSKREIKNMNKGKVRVPFGLGHSHTQPQRFFLFTINNNFKEVGRFFGENMNDEKAAKLN